MRIKKSSLVCGAHNSSSILIYAYRKLKYTKYDPTKPSPPIAATNIILSNQSTSSNSLSFSLISSNFMEYIMR